MAKKILISGGSGLIGRKLTELLQQRGYSVSWLTRKKNPALDVEQHEWDWEKEKIDGQAFQGIYAVVHLAGTSLNEKRWTRSFKEEIHRSRIKSTAFLAGVMSRQTHKPEVFISGSAAGYYGHLTSEHIYKEADQAGDDFLARTCVDWERAAIIDPTAGIRNVQLRTGVVLTDRGGALPEMLKLFRPGLGAQLGHGRQYFSWIHLHDACEAIVFAMEHAELRGPVNLTVPGYITNAGFTRSLAGALGRKILLPPVPGWALKLLYGEVSDALLGGSRIKPEKLLEAGFVFQYSDLAGALEVLIKP